MHSWIDGSCAFPSWLHDVKNEDSFMVGEYAVMFIKGQEAPEDPASRKRCVTYEMEHARCGVWLLVQSEEPDPRRVEQRQRTAATTEATAPAAHRDYVRGQLKHRA